jgi:enamine deaminase RidA (YjgF/YER057c/UK114 family)
MSTKRQLISSGSPFEPRVGMSRAVRVGNWVSVSGTAPLGSDGRTVGRGDPAAQMRRCLEVVASALEKAGARLDDVVRTRILLTRIEDWEAVTRVHGEVFGEIRPANTVMQVTRFIDPEWLVEIEADALVQRRPSTAGRPSGPSSAQPIARPTPPASGPAPQPRSSGRSRPPR